MKKRNITTAELAKRLDVSVPQIYKWNRAGIDSENKHFHKLKEIIPEVQPKEPKITKRGEKDQRIKAGRPRKKTLTLTNSEMPDYREKEFKSAIFPKLYIKDKTT
jgi:hypothetical protein